MATPGKVGVHVSMKKLTYLKKDSLKKLNSILVSHPNMCHRMEVSTLVMEYLLDKPGHRASVDSINSHVLEKSELDEVTCMLQVNLCLVRYSTEGSAEKILSEQVDISSGCICYQIDEESLHFGNIAYARRELDFCLHDVYNQKDLTCAAAPAVVECLMNHQLLFEEFCLGKLDEIFKYDESLITNFTRCVLLKAKECPENNGNNFKLIDKLCSTKRSYLEAISVIINDTMRFNEEARLSYLKFL